jgi:hypothetical protein
LLLAVFVLCDLVLIGDDAPVVFGDRAKVPERLEVRLVEAREHIVAVVDLELGV